MYRTYFGGIWTLFAYIIGILSGAGLPIQTGINSKLRARVGSPLIASLVSFTGGLIMIVMTLIVTGVSPFFSMSDMLEEPAWIWLGGPCGVVLVIGSILVMPKLGSAETVILAVLGQVLTSLVIENFGIFRAAVIPFGATRAAGAVLVTLGAALTTLEKRPAADGPQGKKASPGHGGASVWLYRAIGLVVGIASSCQVAINSRVSTVVGSPSLSSFISFTGATLLIALICMTAGLAKGKPSFEGRERPENHWWLWIGGLFGFICVQTNVVLAAILGTGLTVVITLIGQIGGGVMVDVLGILGAQKKRITLLKILGITSMIIGAALIRLV